MIWRGRDDSEDLPPEAGRRESVPEDGAGSVGTRIESILDAAERAAIGIREDAQEWAGRYLEESRRKADDIAAERIQEISALTDNLVSRARAVAQQSDELIAALDDAGRRALNNARPGSPAPAAAPPPAAAAAQPPPVPQQAPPPPPPAAPPKTQVERPPAAQQAPPPQAPPPLREEPPPPSAPEPPPAAQPAPSAPRVSEGARLLATQMAVAGSTRDEISWRLREEFGIQDSTAILDEIGI